MPKIYASKPADGPLAKQLKNLSQEERRVRRSVHHFKLPQITGNSLTRDGITLVIERRALLENGVLRVVLDAFDEFGVRLPFDPLIERTFDFWNVPLCVHDGTWRQEVSLGRTIDVMNMKEDVAEAFQLMLFAAVLKHARAQGWVG